MSTYVSIQAITLSTAAASVEFTGIPQNYTDLVLQITGNVNSSGYIDLQVGNNTVDTGSNYSRTYAYGDGTAPAGQRNSNSTASFLTIGKGTIVGNSISHFMSYSNSSTNKTILHRANDADNFTTMTVTLWRSTSSINVIKITGGNSNNLNSGMTLTLYGVGTGSPKAFGGDEVRTDGTYWYHIFRSSGRFEPVQNLSCDLLVVAGGGGGGNDRGGGGGAGGYRSFTAQSLGANTAYAVTVGAGGNGATVNTNKGSNGSNSVFGTFTSSGGGGGGSILNFDGAAGGSGGGGFGTSVGGTAGTGGAGNSGSYSPVEGFAGANGSVNTNRNGGGGGGASEAGNTDGLGEGGDGTASSITGTSVTYAGGGGGGSQASAGGGGTGGGGAGAISGPGTAGTANTGGGGGGGGDVASPTKNGGNGGSGIVIVRYAV